MTLKSYLANRGPGLPREVISTDGYIIKGIEIYLEQFYCRTASIPKSICTPTD